MTYTKDKLRAEDIVVKTPNQQVKEAILHKYNSIGAFAEAVQLYPSTVEKYLRESGVHTDKFKAKLMKALDMGYDEIILDAEKQIERLVVRVRNSIKHYRDEKDEKILDCLKNLCIEYNKEKEAANVYGMMGMHQFYRNNTLRAVELIKIGISMLAGKNHDNLLMELYSDLGLVYYYDLKYLDAEEAFREAAKIFRKCSDVEARVAFWYQYRHGILYNNTSKHKKALEKFNIALEYARSKHEIGNALMNMGIVYKRLKKYDEALKYYIKALKYHDTSMYKSIILNNMAEVYRVKGCYEQALCHINKAFEYTGDDNIGNLLIFSQTYMQIEAMQGAINKGTNKMLDLLERYIDDNYFMYKKFIIDSLNLSLDTLIKSKDYQQIYMFEDKIYKLIMKTDNINLKKDLYLVFGMLKCYQRQLL